MAICHVWAERMLEIASSSSIGETKVLQHSRGGLDHSRARTLLGGLCGPKGRGLSWPAGARPGAESGETQMIHVGAGAGVGGDSQNQVP